MRLVSYYGMPDIVISIYSASFGRVAMCRLIASACLINVFFFLEFLEDMLIFAFHLIASCVFLG